MDRILEHDRRTKTLAMTTEKLNKLATACNSGACNPLGIVNQLAAAVQGLDQQTLRESNAFKCIVGQLGFLIKEGIGPSTEALIAFEKEQT